MSSFSIKVHRLHGHAIHTLSHNNCRHLNKNPTVNCTQMYYCIAICVYNVFLPATYMKLKCDHTCVFHNIKPNFAAQTHSNENTFHWAMAQFPVTSIRYARKHKTAGYPIHYVEGGQTMP